MTNFVLFFIAVIVTIILGIKTKVNMGIYAFAFAFILGVWRIKDFSATKIIALFPMVLFYNFFIASAFFGFATENGTIDLLAKKIMYKFRNSAWVAPLIGFLITFILALCGSGAGAIVIGSALAFSVASQVGFNPFLAVTGSWIGFASATFFPFSSTGAVNTGVMQASLGYDAGLRGGYLSGVLGCVWGIVTFIIVCFIFGGFKNNGKTFITDKPPAYSKIQKKTIATIIIVVAILVIPTLIQMVAPNPATKWMCNMFSIQMVWTVGVIVLGLMKCADTKIIIANRVGWNSVILIAGMGTLFGLATSLGVVTILGHAVSSAPKTLVIPAIVLICGILSFFVSGLIITPFFMPMAMTLAAISGSSVILIAAIIAFGGIGSSISPVSTGGAMALTGCTDENLRPKLMGQMMIFAFINIVTTVIYSFVVQFIIH